MSRKKQKFAKAFVAIFLFVGALFAVMGSEENRAYAQNSFGVKLQPAIIEERVDPGEVRSFRITVTNIDPSGNVFNLLSRDITSVRGDGTPVFGDESSPEAADFGVSSWILFEESKIEIAPGESRDITFSVKVPEDAAPGGHFGGIFVVKEGENIGTLGSGVGYEVGTILSLRVAGEAIEEARIREFSADRNLYSVANVSFIARIENLGNVLVRPRGPLDIVNMFGSKVGQLSINGDAAAVFPGGMREFKASWKSGDLAFGRYEAILALTYGEEGKKTITSSLSFWVLPIKIILLVFGSLTILLGGIVMALKFYIRKKLQEAGAVAGRSTFTRYASSGLPFSHLLFVTLTILFFTLLFLGLLFLFFG